MSTLYSIYGEQRPRMDVPASKKDREYHRRMARADLGSLNTDRISSLNAKAWRIEMAYADKMLTQEDIDTFMLDDSMNTRNRTMFNFNMVRPIIEQYRGTAVQSTFGASAVPVTYRSETRRMIELGQQKIMHALSETSDVARTVIGSRFDLGETMQETEAIFESLWQDRNIKAMNSLLQRMAEMNDMERYNSDDMLRFAIWGILPVIARSGAHFQWERIHPSEFFFDPNVQEPDLSDASFMGVFPMMGMPRVAELYDLDPTEVAMVEEALKAYGGGGNLNVMGRNKVRVTTDYWMDVMYQEFGYVMRQGVPTLVRVGEAEGIRKGEEVTYNDLIDPPDEEAKELFGGRKSRKSYVECVRFADLILWEDLAGGTMDDAAKKRYSEGKLPDLVLDYGLYPLQEYDPFDPSRARLPIKAVTFAMAAGEVISPVQSVLEPNRFINRVLSAVEGQANMSGGKSLGVDMDLVDPALTEEDVSVRAKQGRVIPFRAQGRGVNNAMASHDDSMGSGAYAMLQIVSAVQDLIRTVTGVNATFAGEAQKNQLVGVTDVLVQRGALMMEPVHDAFADLKLQKYRCMATAGKEFYMQRPSLLMDMVSDADLLPLMQGRDFALERFNITIRRDNPDQGKRKLANEWLNLLLQQGLIDRTRFADLYDRSYVPDVAAAVRQYAAELSRAEAQAQREQAKQQMLQGLAAQYQQEDANEADAFKQEMDMNKMLAKEGAKEKAAVTKAELAAQLEKDRSTLPVR